jgi:hypothetical protein
MTKYTVHAFHGDPLLNSSIIPDEVQIKQTLKFGIPFYIKFLGLTSNNKNDKRVN